MILRLLIVSMMVSSPTLAAGKKKVIRKTQEVNFDGADIDGVVRTPDGSYLLQKRGVDFVPLYEVKRQIKDNVKDSVEYLR
ncbi:MAG: hypothetical protein KDD22_05180 [Bdellovibrionales bacterium]|nr:hypothetical protein [Bdellovibrionales bacterium]